MKRVLMLLATTVCLTMGLSGIVSAESQTEKVETKIVKVQDQEYTVKEEKGTFYVTEEIGLNVRALPTKESDKLGVLEYGEQVKVTGFVYAEITADGKKSEKKTDWVEITYAVKEDGKQVEKDAYIKNLISKDDPTIKEVETAAETTMADETAYAECPYCGDWYETGSSYRNHVMACQSRAEESTDYGQCPNCGEWFETGSTYRNHVLACMSQNAQDEETVDTEYVQCEDCGGWYEVGNVFRNHICSGRS